jgi:hypothetical protein
MPAQTILTCCRGERAFLLPLAAPESVYCEPLGIPAPKPRVSGVDVSKLAELLAVASGFLLPVSLSDLELYFCFS